MIEITKTVEIWNPNTLRNDKYNTYQIEGIGHITISEFEELNNEQIKAYAQYRKACLEGEIIDLREKIKEIDQVLVSMGLLK
jgi:C-terminal processing protease CtpA/Prc